MKNGEFKIDTKSGVVVFCQKSHGKYYCSVSRAYSVDEFNIGIGQLIAMKRNEIKIRKVDIENMRSLSNEFDVCIRDAGDCVQRKLMTNFKQITDEKINASLNHIRELNADLKALYNGTYNELPDEIKDGSKIYAVVNGSVKIVDNHFND